MEKRKKILGITALVGILLVVLGIVAVTSAKAQSNGAIQISFQGALVDVVRELEQIKDIIGLTETEEPSFGASAGPEHLVQQVFTEGFRLGADFEGKSQGFDIASTTICTYDYPREATSTVDYFITIQTATDTVHTIFVGTTTSAVATFDATGFTENSEYAAAFEIATSGTGAIFSHSAGLLGTQRAFDQALNGSVSTTTLTGPLLLLPSETLVVYATTTVSTGALQGLGVYNNGLITTIGGNYRGRCGFSARGQRF